MAGVALAATGSAVCAGPDRAAADRDADSSLPRLDAPEQVYLQPEDLQPVTSPLRIASYNLENFTDGSWDGPDRTRADLKRQTHGAAEIIAGIAPDIIVMQEIENRRSLERLNRAFKTPFPAVYVTKFAPRRKDSEVMNVAVMSRVPLAALREFDFEVIEEQDAPPRGVLSFIVVLEPRHLLLVYAVHLKSNVGPRRSNVAQRQKALNVIREDVRNITAKYAAAGIDFEVLIMGDMNTDPTAKRFADDDSLRPLADFVDLWAGIPLSERITMPSREGDEFNDRPPTTFDRAFCSTSLQEEPWVVVRPYRVKQGVDVRHAWADPGSSIYAISDHYPIYVDLYLKAPAPEPPP